MRCISRVGVLAFVSIALVAAADGQAPRAAGRADQEVRDAITQCVRAYGTNDIQKYFSFYAPELTWWGPGGRSDKETYHKSWAEGVQKTGGLASAEASDLQVQVSPAGDMAIASYLLKVKRRNPNPPTRTEFVTYEMSPTLVKRNGRWTIVHLHFQVVPEPKATS